MARNLPKRLWFYFLQLNIYKKSFDNGPSSSQDLIATRTYVCTFVLSILITTIIATFYIRTITSVEYSPLLKRFSKLSNDYPNTLHCVCSQISITYKTFVSIETKLHQVCSSEFVKQGWIDQVFAQHNQLSSSFDDYRITLSFFWQIISRFCVISEKTWSDIVIGFEGSSLVSPTAITEQSVRSQIRETIKNEQSLSQGTLTRNLRLLQRMISGNQFVSSMSTNFQLHYSNGNSSDEMSPRMLAKNYDNCSCLNLDGCPHPATFNDATGQLVIVPGMLGDCLIMDGTLASTLECYYDQTCISLLHQSLANDVQPLSIDRNKRFHPNSTIRMLFDEIMLDELVDEIRYDQYYTECNPSYCSYSYSRRFDVLFVITTVIGLVGTLSMIIRIISPVIASLYLRWKNRTAAEVVVPEQNQGNIFDRLRHLSNYVRRTLVEFNLFEERSTRTPTVIHREILLTRVFVLLMIMATIGITFYAFLNKESQVKTVTHPSLATYSQLYQDHPDSFKCPCSKLSISYDKFLNFSAILHQVCSSDLISPVWLNYLASLNPDDVPPWTKTPFSRDFRTIGATYFQLLKAFCSLAETNMNSAKERINDMQFVNDYVINPTRFLEETGAMTHSFVTTTNSHFAQDHDWMSIIFSTSYFLSGTNINFLAVVNNDDVDIDIVYLYRLDYIEHGEIGISSICTCGVDLHGLACDVVTILYSNSSQFDDFDQVFWEIRVCCVPIFGFIRYDINWWYNGTYLKNIQKSYATVLHSLPSSHIQSLNRSVRTQFESVTLNDLLRKMFIEEWLVDGGHFDRFYNECAPSSCSFTVYERRPTIVVLLLIIAICGGLNRGLRLFVSFIGKIAFLIVNKWKNENIPGPENISIITRIFRAIANANLFETEDQSELTKRKQKFYTKIYLILFIGSLSVILFYTVIIQRSVMKTYMIHSIEEYERLHDLHEKDLNCPCNHISIPYDDFITALAVNAFHQACIPRYIHEILLDGKSG